MDIRLISEEETRQLLFEFNNTEAAYWKDKTIHGLFEEQAGRTPDNIALIGNGHHRLTVGKDITDLVQMTYRELSEKSNRLASLLQENGVIPDTIVGILLERSLEMIVGVLGILKADGAYLPIDPDYPRERIQFMLADSKARVVVTTSTLDKKIDRSVIREKEKIFVDTANGLATSAPSPPPQPLFNAHL